MVADIRRSCQISHIPSSNHQALLFTKDIGKPMWSTAVLAPAAFAGCKARYAALPSPQPPSSSAAAPAW